MQELVKGMGFVADGVVREGGRQVGALEGETIPPTILSHPMGERIRNLGLKLAEHHLGYLPACPADREWDFASSGLENLAWFLRNQMPQLKTLGLRLRVQNQPVLFW